LVKTVGISRDSWWLAGAVKPQPVAMRPQNMGRQDGEHSSRTRTGLATNLSPELRDLLKRYGLALALASVALVLRGQLALPEATAIYQLPLAAVVLSAWYGGRGPGVFASVICAAGTLYWFIPPVGSFKVAPDHVLGFAIF